MKKLVPEVPKKNVKEVGARRKLEFPHEAKKRQKKKGEN